MYLPFDSLILVNGEWVNLVKKDDSQKYVETIHQLEDGTEIKINPESSTHVKGVLVYFEDGTSIILPAESKVVTSEDLKLPTHKLAGKCLPIYSFPVKTDKVSSNYVNGIYFSNGVMLSNEKDSPQYISIIGMGSRDRFPEKHFPSLNPPIFDGYELNWLEGVLDAVASENDNVNEFIIKDRPYSRLNTIALIARSHGFSVSIEKYDLPPPFTDSGYSLTLKGPFENLHIRVTPENHSKIEKTSPVKSIHHVNGYIICVDVISTKYTKLITRDCTYYV